MIIQKKLFDMPEKPVIIIDRLTSGKRCKQCTHIYKHQYGKMKYCEMQKDPITSYGHKKIKANDTACNMFDDKNYKDKRLTK